MLPREVKVEESPQNVSVDRQPRYLSHAIVEIRKFKRIPLFAHSAVLLDISIGGYKVEFTSEVTLESGSRFWIHIPLTPLGIFAPSKLLCKAEAKWFDEKRFRVGGIFVDLDPEEKRIIEHVVEKLGLQGNTA